LVLFLLAHLNHVIKHQRSCSVSFSLQIGHFVTSKVGPALRKGSGNALSPRPRKVRSAPILSKPTRRWASTAAACPELAAEHRDRVVRMHVVTGMLQVHSVSGSACCENWNRSCIAHQWQSPLPQKEDAFEVNINYSIAVGLGYLIEADVPGIIRVVYEVIEPIAPQPFSVFSMSAFFVSSRPLWLGLICFRNNVDGQYQQSALAASAATLGVRESAGSRTGCRALRSARTSQSGCLLPRATC